MGVCRAGKAQYADWVLFVLKAVAEWTLVAMRLSVKLDTSVAGSGTQYILHVLRPILLVSLNICR